MNRVMEETPGTAYPALSPTSIHTAIDQICEDWNTSRTTTFSTEKNRKHQPQSWHFARARLSSDMVERGRDLQVVPDLENDERQSMLLYGIKADSKYREQDKGTVVLITFYLAYSTWDGRVLYLDQWQQSDVTDNHEQTDSTTIDLTRALYQILAAIAVRLQCNRFTWQRDETVCDADGKPRLPPMFPTDISFPLQPEFLHSWLTLHWENHEFRTMLDDSFDRDRSFALAKVNPSAGGDTGHAPAPACYSIGPSINDCLRKLSTNSEFQFELATAETVDDVVRLVRGLAEYEREPDAVNVTRNHYLQDGFQDYPLFYCILIRHIGQEDATICGMAFCYLGYNISSGLFLYLEDLFIEDAYRRMGAGSLTMKALAAIGATIGCHRIVWQVLDWNTPAIAFYSKMGAYVKEGLKTYRFARDSLRRFSAFSID